VGAVADLRGGREGGFIALPMPDERATGNRAGLGDQLRYNGDPQCDVIPA
jgi:hypothetical protein